MACFRKNLARTHIARRVDPARLRRPCLRPHGTGAGSQDHRLLSSPVPPHSAGFFCLGPVTGPRASPLWQGNGRGRGEVCKPNCKPTTRHRPVSGNTSQHRWPRNAKRKHTLSYKAIQASMRIIELENRCTGNRTVGSNPTLSVQTRCCIRGCGGFSILSSQLSP